MTRSPSSRDNPLERVVVALDTEDLGQFEQWCALFGPRVGMLKVGLQAFVRWGGEAVEHATAYSRVFLDLKLHDIPATVAGAVDSAAGLGASWLTVHAAGGPAMLEAAVDAAAGRVQILAVTVLTSLDETAAELLDWPGSLADRVSRWAALAAEQGCAGVVASPHETARLRSELAHDFLLVVPGIRPAGSDAGDQRRVATPARALEDGADAVVIGRPLTRAADPERALEALARELAGAAGPQGVTK